MQNRYKCAKVGVEETMWNATNNVSYGWVDFATASQLEIKSKVRTFYLANAQTHATANGMSGWFADLTKFASMHWTASA